MGLVIPDRSPQPTQVADEFLLTRFGDKRLTSRCVRIAHALQRSPGVPLPSALASSTELEAAYSFFNNPKVTSQALLAPHFDASFSRLSSVSDWLCIHDTSEMEYSGPRVGLGPLSDKRQGFLAHVSLAVSADSQALPLGVVATEFLTRKPLKKRSKGKRRSRSRQQRYSLDFDNEHSRWERAIAHVERRSPVSLRPLHLLDREGDSYLLQAQMVDHGRRFVIRLTHDRVLATSRAGQTRISDLLAGLPVLARRDIRVPARQPKLTAPQALRKHPARTEREAHVVLTATRITLPRPQKAPRWLPPSLELNLVCAREVGAPAGVEPVEWRLLTSEPVDTPEAVERVVDSYRKRWLIEEFFLALKSGCAVLEREFEKASALQNIIAMSLPLAWQMLALRTEARREEPVPVARVLTSLQVALLVAASQRLPPRQRPSANPSAREALLAIAALGGHLTRNGEPGWKTLSRGFHKLREMESNLALLVSVHERLVKS